MLALTMRDWKADERLLTWQVRQSMKCIGSQINEDDIRLVKACEKVSMSKRVADHRLYMNPVVKRVAEDVHRFDSPLQHGAADAPRGSTLPADCFKPAVEKSDARFKELASEHRTLPHFSPGSEGFNIPVADLILTEYMEDNNNYGAIHNFQCERGPE
jgi:hypothetical protein